MRKHRIAVAIAAAAVIASGCSSPTTGSAAPGAPADPCSILPLDTAAKYINKTDKPLALRKGIYADSQHRAGFAECRYGTATQPGVTLAFPLGDPAPALADLVKSSVGAVGEAVTVGDDKAYLATAHFESVIAVQHGGTQFVIRRHPILGGTENGDRSITGDRMKELAGAVAGKMSAAFALPRRDLPTQCDKIASPDDIVGKSGVAFGSAGADGLECDFAGPNGVLHAEVTALSDNQIQSSITNMRQAHPQREILPPLADGTATFLDENQRNGLWVEAFVEGRGQVRVLFAATSDDRKRGSDFDAAERAFVTGFSDAATAWQR